MTIRILTAERVLPITSPPIHDGAVATSGDRIDFAGSRAEAEVRADLA
jgi:hypothetical protein